MLSWMTTAVLAIALCSFVPVLPPAWANIGLLILSLSCALVWRRGWAMSLLAVALGVAYGSAYGDWRLSNILPEALEALPLQAEIQVTSQPELRPGKSDYYRFDASARLIDCGSRTCPQRLGNVRLNWYEASAPRLGSKYRVVVKLKRPRGYASPGAFDYGHWLFVQGYSATGYVKEVVAAESGAEPIPPRLWRQALVAHYQGRLRDYRESGLMRALLFGDRSSLTPAHWNTLAETGTGHLMAISGMHIGIVAAWVFALARAVAGLLPRSIWSLRFPALASFIAALAYSALAGFSLPTVRALIMLSLLLLAGVLPRKLSSWRILVVAMFLVFVADPLAAQRPGFYLSFGAVGLLFWAFSDSRGPPGRSVLRLLSVQWVLGWGLLPIIALAGFDFAVAGFVANLIAIPLVALGILPLLLLGLVTSIGSASMTEALWGLADMGLQLLMVVLTETATLVPALPLTLAPWQVAALGLLILIFLQPALPGRKLAAVCALLMLVPARQPLPRGHFDLWAIDVGQGLSILVSTRDHTLLFDVGPDFDSGFNSADAVVIPLLRKRGITELDVLVLSHNDRDHAGAAGALLAEMPVARLYRGQKAPVPDTHWWSCHTAAPWSWDGVHFRFLPREIKDGASSNDHSCVLEVRSGRSSALIPGDISARAETSLVARRALAPVNLLIASHHGSNSSSSRAFVDALQPPQVVFSAGYKHAYGHPSAKVMARFHPIDAQCWQTALHGSIHWRFDPRGLVAVEPSRRQRHYWDLPIPATECRK